MSHSAQAESSVDMIFVTGVLHKGGRKQELVEPLSDSKSEGPLLTETAVMNSHTLTWRAAAQSSKRRKPAGTVSRGSNQIMKS